MTTLEIVKELCKNKNISVKLLEEDLDFPNNTIYQWKNRTPGIDKLQKVADYFDVSVDYLLGRKSAVQTHTHDDKEFSTIQRLAKKLNKEEQDKLIKLMELSFEVLNDTEEEDDDEYL